MKHSDCPVVSRPGSQMPSHAAQVVGRERLPLPDGCPAAFKVRCSGQPAAAWPEEFGVMTLGRLQIFWSRTYCCSTGVQPRCYEWSRSAAGCDGARCPSALQLQALVDSCLADDPEERPSAQEVLERLSAMLSNEC